MNEQPENRTVTSVSAHADLDERIAYRISRSMEQSGLDITGTNLPEYAGVYGDYRMKKQALEQIGQPPLPPLPVENGGLVDVREILPYDGKNFLRMAYLCILGRFPADEEIEPTFRAMDCGAISKEQQLFSMADSAEGRLRGALLTGFEKAEVSSLLDYFDRDFVRRASALLLGRKPAQPEEDHQVRRLRSGEVSRIQLLAELKTSEEGKQKGVFLNGFAELCEREEKRRRILADQAAGKDALLTAPESGEIEASELLKYFDRTFVRNAYRVQLGRDADSDGENNYLSRLRSGEMTRVQLLAELSNSPEGRNFGMKVRGLAELLSREEARRRILETIPENTENPNPVPEEQSPAIVDVSAILVLEGSEFIAGAFRAILVREPNQSELEAYGAGLKNGTLEKTELVRSLADSPEAIRRGAVVTGYPELSLAELLCPAGEDFIENAYILLLHRRPDPAGAESWRNQLRSGECMPVDIIFGLAQSEECRKLGISVRGLKRAYRLSRCRKKLGRLPAVGRLFRKRSAGISKAAAEEQLRRTNARIAILNSRSEEQHRQHEMIAAQMKALREELISCRTEFAGSIGAVTDSADRRNSLLLEELDARRKELIGNIGAAFAVLDEAELKIRCGTDPGQVRFAVTENAVSDLRARLEGLSADSARQFARISNLLDGVTDEQTDVKALIRDYSRLSDRVEQLTRAGIPDADCGKDLPIAAYTPEKQDSYSAVDYFDFEDHFRGSRTEVKNKQKIYLPYFSGRQNVLDLGCGRGEFTEMLTENGVGVTGVDQYGPYVEYMKLRGLPAVQDDAVHYLLREERVDGVFLGQVVEHISVNQIIEICNAAYEKLEKGAYLIMETLNPRSLATYTGSFYMDPSHQKPVHPYTLQYLAQKAGFSSVEILYTEVSRPHDQIPELPGEGAEFKRFNEAMKDVSDIMFAPQDYAVIARK